MRFSRVLKRAETKQQKKKVKQQIDKMAKVIDSMSKTCLTCKIAFDPKNPDHLDNWKVNVYADKAELFCEKCYISTDLQENVDEQGKTPEAI